MLWTGSNSRSGKELLALRSEMLSWTITLLLDAQMREDDGSHLVRQMAGTRSVCGTSCVVLNLLERSIKRPDKLLCTLSLFDRAFVALAIRLSVVIFLLGLLRSLRAFVARGKVLVCRIQLERVVHTRIVEYSAVPIMHSSNCSFEVLYISQTVEYRSAGNVSALFCLTHSDPSLSQRA